MPTMGTNLRFEIVAISLVVCPSDEFQIAEDLNALRAVTETGELW
jgi:hypothetical protein